MSPKIEISDPLNYDSSKLVFGEVEEKTIPGQKSTYYRVGIKTVYNNGKEGDLVFALDRSHSFGISNTYGLTLSVQLYDKEGATERQRKTVEAINAIVERAKDFLVENRKALKKPTLTKAQLDGLSPIKMPIDEKTGNIDETRSPMMNLKLLTSNRKPEGDNAEVSSDPKVLTPFYSEDQFDKEGEPLSINPMDYLNKRCYVTCAVKVDGIFFGQVQRLQVKLFECYVKGVEQKTSRLLSNIIKRQPQVANVDDFAETEESHPGHSDFSDMPQPKPFSSYENEQPALASSDNEEENNIEQAVPVVTQRKKGKKN